MSVAECSTGVAEHQASVAPAAVIKLLGVHREYVMGGQVVQALRGIDLDIRRNDYVAIIGASGSGKSTLMNIIGCLDKPTHGQYLLNGHAVAEMGDNELAGVRNTEIGFIFQSFNLLPRMDALHNVMQPLVYRRMPYVERREWASEALRKVGLTQRMGHLPNELSGGQRQRVAVARALVGNPSILLADEPTGNLDSATTGEIMTLFDQLQADGQTVVVVTHEPEIARRCHRVITLHDGLVKHDQQQRPHTC
ncbi:putative ABC transport system ATP-binding protein [Xanthomonas arboricola]|uniref:ABC transporter ATP-binding protein n=1 Tax=Xanthomonas TaxID=338 RepID=UPI001791C480|nr:MULTISPECIES: ABC transporter ATP-binding protein [Xanthomonas]MBB3811700.1 putative ABC transport system ATP-binding protein [Xanthomonas euroxanthea]